MDSIFEGRSDVLNELREAADDKEKLRTLKEMWKKWEVITEDDYRRAAMCLMRRWKAKKSPPAPQPSPRENLSLQISELNERRAGRTEGALYRSANGISFKPSAGTFWLLVKPCQAGKTFTMLERIVESLRDENKMSIILCENSLLATALTKTRTKQHAQLGIVREEERKFGDQERRVKVIEFSSARSAEARDIAHVKHKISENDVDIIIACSHPTRFANIDELMIWKNKKQEEEGRCTRGVEIFLDEADKYVTSPKRVEQINRWRELGAEVTFITATPDDGPKGKGILKTFASKEGATMNLMVLEEAYSAEHYAGMKEWVQIVVEEGSSGESAKDYIKRVLHNYPLRHGIAGEKMGEYIFAPAKFKRETHEDVSDFLLNKGVLVIIINGVHKEMRWKDEKGVTQTLNFVPHIGRIGKIAEIIWKFAVPKAKELGKCIAVTGFWCVERALTLQRANLIFDRGILTPGAAKTRASAYQLSSRVNGNIKKMDGYKRPRVFTSAAAYQRMRTMEDMSMFLANEATRGKSEEPRKINHSEYNDKFCEVEARRKNNVGMWTSEPWLNSEDGKIPDEIWESSCDHFNKDVAGKSVVNTDGSERRHHEGASHCIGTRSKEDVERRYHPEERAWYSSDTGKKSNKIFLSDIKKTLSTGVSSKNGKTKGQMVRVSVVYADAAESELYLILRYCLPSDSDI